ncbi:YbeD family protein [Spiribacter onubensis]|uniref:UPF0250 protein V6X64_00330 n=1 Tax=Spiribacter onubensis TaxID=3122420 RepID=A0ABV3S5P7_9GAMM
MDELNERPEGLTFPCEFPVKAMGPVDSGLPEAVRHIVAQHAPDVSEESLYTAHSSGGRFMSVTVTITARSRAQLDAIYADLQAHDGVLATL